MGGGRAPCCDKSKVKRGPWSPAEDSTLVNFVVKHGCSNWRALPKQAGLLRCGKSCRLRWINYLRPDVKRGNFTPEEEQTIINLHNSFGNKWSKIASCLPGRTDNEIKNVWNTHLKKRLTKNVTENSRKNGGEDSSTKNSGSPSSSSITTLEDQKTEMKPGDGTVQESRIQKPEPLNAKATHLSDGESKETASSESPVYFHASNFSNSNQVNASGSNQEPIVNQGNGSDHGNGAIQFESDIDFWELLDSLDPSQFTQTEQNGVNVDFSLFNPAEKFGSEVECNKWLTLLENELGLTSDNFPKDQEMNFEPAFSPAVDYFPIWNCLP